MADDEIIIIVDDEPDTVDLSVEAGDNEDISADAPEVQNDVTEEVEGDKYYTDLAKQWAIASTLILGEDYSSKYYANQAKNYKTSAATSENNAAQSAIDANSYKVAAGNSALAAATSEDNAQAWAEGTDEEVEALGGTHSAKEWVSYIMGNAPTVTAEQTATGAEITVTDAVHGATTVELLNGADGQDGQDGQDGSDGADGQDGFSPIATVTSTATGATISITDANGTTTANITNGIDGTDGTDGQAATIAVGTVTTGAAGSSATVTNSGTSSAAVFDFTIPKGDKGDKGDTGNTGATGQTGATGNGIVGTQKTSTSGLVDTYTITYTNGDTDTFTVTNGQNGTGSVADVQVNNVSVLSGDTAYIDLTGYQPLLVSGTNIKTINNNSLLGNGNITIDSLPSQTGQSGKFLTTNGTSASWATVNADNVFIATYGTTTYQEVLTAYNAGKTIYAKRTINPISSINDCIYYALINYSDNDITDTFRFSNCTGKVIYTVTLADDNTWSIASNTLIANTDKATSSTFGIVQPDGSTITVNNGVISATPARNIGEIVQSTIPLTDAGLHLLDGSLISGSGSYADFVTYIAGLVNSYPNLFVTEATWQSSVTTYGVCGKFVYDSTNNTVRLPKITGIVEGTIDATALGDLVEAGLPNITGSAAAINNFGILGGMPDVSGCFTEGVTTNGTLGGASTTGKKLNFDASNSNSIYGNSNTVQPQTIKAFVYIVIATSAKTDIQVDIDEIATDLNGKADTDLTNVTDTGYIKMASASMPSATAISLTVGTSGTTYTAPADGWVTASFTVTGTNGWGLLTSNSVTQHCYWSGAGGSTYAHIPVSKGSIFGLYYGEATCSSLVFIYAVGSESEAS